MKKTARNLIASGMLAATLLGSGAAVASAQSNPTTTTSSTSSTTGSTSSSSTRPDAPSKADHEARHAERTAALAKALGVSTDKVTAAETAARAAVDAEYGKPTRPTGTPGEKPAEPTDAQKAEMKARHDLFEKTFAKELGVTTAQLKAANLKLAKAHLAEEVADGRITQAEADARLKAIEDGTAPMGGHGGPGGPGGHGHGGPPPAAGSSSSSTTTN